MDWFTSLFTVHSSIQTVVIISVIIAVGLALGKIRVMGISLGIAFVFFAGIVAGNIGMSIDGVTLDYAETFGLSMFVYCLGLHVGPNFFGSLRHEGMMLNVWSLAVIALGTVFALVLSPLTGISIPVMTGLLCGATTNTPALGAATQALAHAGLPSSNTALATAVTYPLGVVGVIIAMVLIRKFFVKPTDLEVKKLSDDNHTYIAQFTAINPAIIGRTIQQIAQMTHVKFIISRIWRGKQVIVPVATTELHVNDKLLVVTNKEDEQAMTLLFGKKENDLDWNKEDIDWNAIDANVESRVCVITRPSLNGKHLGALHYGDRITIVGKHENLDNAEHFFGNSVKTLEEPNIGSIFLGIVLGLILGSIPLSLPGMESPIRLGIAGGPIIMGIIVGALGPRLHLISYTTRSASLMLRKLGLSLYLACLGLDAGKDFLSTVIKPEGLVWVGIGFLITLVPILIIGIIALKAHRYDFGTICGILCGSMANPMALGYANDTLKGDTASISYASVYPLGMFIRVVIAQMIIMFFV